VEFLNLLVLSYGLIKIDQCSCKTQ